MSKRDFISETHPNLHRIGSAYLPMMHVIVAGFWLLWETMTGFRTIIAISKTLVPGWQLLYRDYDRWVEVGYLDELMLIVMVILLVIVFLYAIVWRAVFPRYIIRYCDQHHVVDGRCYWRTDNLPTRLWDRLWGSPERTTVDYWLHRGAVLNIIYPPASMTRLTTTVGERNLRSIYDLIVEEVPGRYLAGHRHLKTSNVEIPWTSPDLDYTTGVFVQRSSDLVRATAELSHANPHVRLDMLSDVSYYEDPRIFTAHIQDDDEEKEDGHE